MGTPNPKGEEDKSQRASFDDAFTGPPPSFPMRYSSDVNRQLPPIETAAGPIETGPRAGRRRGYSLRTQMFNRLADKAPSPIEMSGYGPHNTDIQEEPIFAAEDGKKSRDDEYRSDELPNYASWAAATVGPTLRLRRRARELYAKARSFVLQHKTLPPSKNGRKIPIELVANRPPLIDERTAKPYVSNLITSSIYTPYNFVPRQLIAQFSKLANLYFMFVSILQMIPSWSTTGNYTTIIPLMVFISISMGREAFDDWRRHRQDKTENNRTTLVATIDPGLYSDRRENSIDTCNTRQGTVRYEERVWKDVKVGDVVKLKQNDWVPADIVLLHSEGEQGLSYIETMALDGETNLKTREALPDLAELASSDDKLAALRADITTEDPNLDLYNFEATVTINAKTYPLSSSNIVYRGSALRNTPSAIGLVVFSGEETKIRMNAVQSARTKAPRLQKKANNVVIFMVVFVIGLSIFSLVASKLYYSAAGKNMWFIKGLEVGTVPNLMGFIIMYNTLIPLSLYVSMEIVRVFQMVMLQLDIDMYHEESNTRCEAKTASINEELGQVSYIFSDKTGTLTDNIMLFRKLSVAGHAWLHDLDMKLADTENAARLFHQVTSEPHSKALRKAESSPAVSGRRASVESPYSPRPSMDMILQQVAALPRKSTSNMTHRPSTASIGGSVHSGAWKSTAAPGKVQSARSTIGLLQYLQTHPTTAYAKRARFFLLAMALCHTCLPDTQSDTNSEIENLEYQAASPDELALVEAARDLGFIVIDRQHHTVTVRTYPNGFDQPRVDESYEVLEVIEFSSARKRMSIIMKFPDGRLCLFCKGADNVIIDRLREKQLALAKAEEINKQSSQRKAAEAELVVARHSMSTAPRMSMGTAGKPSLSLGGGRPSINMNRKQALATLDDYLTRVKQDDDVEQIAESSRRSMTLARQRKYGESPAVSRPSRSSRDMSRSSKEISRPSRGELSRSSKDAMGVRFSVEELTRRSQDIRPQKSINTRPAEFDENYYDDDMADEEDEIEIDDRLVLNDSYVMERTLEHIEEFSTEGLRTLLYGHRFLDKEEYDSWAKLYRDARTSLVDRQEKIEKVGEAIERELELCGATAIEDKLQEGVPEAIDKLRRANIKLWMLTGDKRETAINIGYSCRLIKDYSTVVVLRSDEGDVAGKMAAAMLSLDGGNVAHCVVVIDGMTLGHIEEDMTLMTLFVDLGVKADSVICCRASPAQKASMVKAVRKKVKSAITLAIGDGANDIAMIQAADVGIGITGKEGLQAARSSDFSIGQFRFLLKLLLVHGRWNYVRLCKYILGTFYKEFLFYLTQAIYQRNTLFTGTSMYENWSLSMFNTLFTSLPVLCIGILERDLSPTTLIAVPELYSKGQQNQGFGLLIFIGWMVVAASQSVIVSFLTYYLYGFPALKDNTMYPLGALSFTICLLIICTKLQFIEMYTITAVCAAVFIISVGGWFVWDMFLSYIYSKKPSKIYYVNEAIFKHFGTDLSWWASILAAFFLAILFDIVIEAVRVQFWATETEVFQELEQDPAVRHRLEQDAMYELALSKEGEREERRKKLAKKGIDLAEVEAASEESPSEDHHDVERTATAYSASSSVGYRRNGTNLSSTSDLLMGERKRDKIKKKLRFAPRKTSGEYEREIEQILERREMEMDEMR